jgi:hypothetical protein
MCADWQFSGDYHEDLPIPYRLTPLGSAVAALMLEEEINSNGGT